VTLKFLERIYIYNGGGLSRMSMIRFSIELSRMSTIYIYIYI